MSTTQTKSDYDILSEALDLSELPVEEQEEILIDMQDLVLQGTILRIIEQLDDTTRDEFSRLMDGSPDEEAVLDFIYDHVPEADSIVQETIRDFADDILAVTKE